MHESPVVTRFAPSPTGQLHLGNVRTALLNFLFARKFDGRFLLRFEDTDSERSTEESMQGIEADLRWLGLEWDGTPLHQRKHASRHVQSLTQLAEQGMAYRCFCTEQQLALDRKLAASRGLPSRYSGRCRHLGVEEAEKRAATEPYVWRLAAHAATGHVLVRDVLRGDIVFERSDLDDPVLMRSDHSFTFLLPNAVDDMLDGITHVLRGDDHLVNTAYQILMLQSLGFEPPIYLHHGLLLDAGGGKLSKRSGGHTVAELREAGLFPEALVQAMVRLGHPNLPVRVLSLDELAACFEPERLSTSAVRWQDQAMWRWHAEILHQMSPEELAPRLQPLLPSVSLERLVSLAELLRGNLDRLEDVLHFRRLVDASSFDDPEALVVVHTAGSEFFGQAVDCFHATEDKDWKRWTTALAKAVGRRGRDLYLPLRAALTGSVHGPEMSAVVRFLGKEGVLERLHDVLHRLGKVKS